ncbi:hypothetical protein METBIDRAFT_201371 [Metschnikowia bicuspidata var. bicuspidata NRRL YB-4993]|uniref:Uncharacterized protein n=1 Tax=Metschnikowia bicuspidata var. bicuspidata NRRL YB-4993 TaxID=869754 RepID=A0A1A0H9D4_9ASCO|nr:hypothetical protein METBIDRAFT_201371 [Metschnikowia bicuspidata var. bicuspidata NRRL YB-4993]OBA20605.1 hypothetical protein METBIDRAFT_201371 [Metschnikowia bicuspidata var. bicuspidata NRRL YB-4993]
MHVAQRVSIDFFSQVRHEVVYLHTSFPRPTFLHSRTFLHRVFPRCCLSPKLFRIVLAQSTLRNHQQTWRWVYMNVPFLFSPACLGTSGNSSFCQIGESQFSRKTSRTSRICMCHRNSNPKTVMPSHQKSGVSRLFWTEHTDANAQWGRMQSAVCYFRTSRHLRLHTTPRISEYTMPCLRLSHMAIAYVK